MKSNCVRFSNTQALKHALQPASADRNRVFPVLHHNLETPPVAVDVFNMVDIDQVGTVHSYEAFISEFLLNRLKSAAHQRRVN
jgi:hypothetical protein